jgi:hypothetical protein
MAGCIPLAWEPFFVPVGYMADASCPKTIVRHTGCDVGARNIDFRIRLQKFGPDDRNQQLAL